MTNQAIAAVKPWYRSPGWAAIISGIIGILAAAFLMSFLVVRSDRMDNAMRMANIHDAGVIVQFLLFIPVVYALCKRSRQKQPGMSKTMFAIGLGSVLATALFLFLGLFSIMTDVVYMVPQGIFGVWLIVMCWQTAGILPRWLRWSGMVVGLGLALVGIFPLGYAIFVDTIMFRIPAPPDDTGADIPITPANMVLHQFLWIGTMMGVFTLPFWTILLGWRLLKEKKSISATGLGSF